MESNSIIEQYKQLVRKKYKFMLINIILLILLFIVGVALGPSSVGWSDLVDFVGGSSGAKEYHIISELRLPRVVAALLSGGGLTVSGVVIQSVLRNPLGSPFTLGISNAAAFGAAMVFTFVGGDNWLTTMVENSDFLGSIIVTLSAFIWSMVACGFILIVARLRGATPENMILTGIISSTLFTAMTSVLQYLADDVKLASIVFWTFGDLSKGGWKEIMVQAVIIIPIVLYFIKNRIKFNALDAGDEVAHSLGVNVSRFRLTNMVLSALVTAAIVSFYGIIAFVGLVIPHMVRKVIGGDERFLLPASTLLGAVFLMFCDIVARTAMSPVVIPVGILTSLIGAPLFIFLLMRAKASSKWG